MSENVDFSYTYDGLSEQLFAQLKDFNTEYKYEKNTKESMFNDTFPDSSDSVPLHLQPQDMTKANLDSYGAASEINNPDIDYDINTQLLDLSAAAINKQRNINLEMPDYSVMDLKPPMPLETKTIPVDAANVAKNAIKSKVSSTFVPAEEKMKILQILETPTNQKSDSKIFLPSELPSSAYRIVKCSNCKALFDFISFQSHVCDYDEDHKTILPNQKSSSISQSIKEEPLLPAEPDCIRLLKENQIRIRRFLKDELKYDVNANGNNNKTPANLNSSLNSSSAASTSTSSNGVLNSSSISNLSSTSSAKKQDGPHECTLCERKFVHASGLLRHMEKHAMDLIPSANETIPKKSIDSSNLRVVIKCTLCGRIFFEPNSALIHLSLHYPSLKSDEVEMDNFADIPYESYVDDAINYLVKEVLDSLQSAPNDSKPNNYNEAPPTYLKTVVLSCILQCEFCDLIFSEVSYLFVHSACHVPERRFECFACEIQVKTSKEICYHWQAECVFMRENLKVHKANIQRYFVCNVCENKFLSMEQLQEHRYTSYHFFPRLSKHLGILQLPCEYCESVFENTHECITHYEEKHYKKYKRDGPGGSSSKTRLYLCDVCGKSYTQSSHLWQHLRFHQGVKPFACKEPGCSRKFTIRPDLCDHVRKCHTGERPYLCLVCGKRFLTGSVFYQHRLIHRGERRYECEECGKRFYRADALKNHQRIHTGEKPFGCLFCTKNFRQRGDRDKHIRARHSHLDANSRLMMHMQKLQLESAAAGSTAMGSSPSSSSLLHQQQQTAGSTNLSLIMNNENIAPSSINNTNNVIMIGNVAFPWSMLDSIIPVQDEDPAVRATKQLQ